MAGHLDQIRGNGARDRLVGRWQGKDIVQEGHAADGTPIRWSFVDIAGDSFHWPGERLESVSAPWRLQVEFHAQRVKH